MKNETKQTEKQKPVETFRAGCITASVWANIGKIDGKDTTFYNVSLIRGYKDKDGTWKETSTYKQTDIPKAILVMQKAYEYLSMKEYEEKE